MRSSIAFCPAGVPARRRRIGLPVQLVLILLATMVAGAFTKALPAPVAAAATPVSDDWPTYLHDAARSDQSADTTVPAANVQYFQKRFGTKLGGMIAGEPAIVNGVAYIGAWDGYEYALNASTGAIIWKTSLGKVSDPVCVPPTMGITSSATVFNGVVYVGGGNDASNQSEWYALNASTGAVLWSVPTGDGTQAGGHYNWSSPLIITDPADGLPYAYIGIASTCDAPLVQGLLLKVSLASHQIVGTAKMVPDGQVGGGIWTSPAYDAASNRIFLSTGTLNLYSQTLSQAVVSVNATSMTVVDSWQLPFEAAVSDSDWGTTPTLTTDSAGNRYVSLANKNGILYTLRRTNMAAGPVWQRQVAYGGDCPTCGDGSIASGVFANGTLYYAGGSNTDATGLGHQGFVSAYNPGTGALLWTHETNAPVLGSIIGANGMIFDAQGSVVEALNASTGASLWTYNIGAGTYGAPAFAEGSLYLGALNGTLYSFALPATLPGSPPADANCPSGFTCQDIGNGSIPGSETVNANGSVSVTASGNWRTNGDVMRMITKPVSGSFQASVEDLSETKGTLTGYAQPQVGIIVRQSAATGSPFYVALQDPQYPAEGESLANLIIYYRDTWGGPIVELTQTYPQAFPRYIMVQRHFDTFQTLFSTNGTNWTLISGTVHTMVMPTTLMVGMGVASGTASASTTAVYTGFNVTPTFSNYIEQNEPHPCPTSWSCYDVGAGSPLGDETVSGGVWTVLGGGEGVNLETDGLGNNRIADQFHYIYQKTPGDSLLTGRLTALASGSAAAQATLMMRADTSPASPFYGVVVTPNLNAVVQWRTNNGIQQRTTVPLGTVTLPEWFRINRYTDTSRKPVQTYYSLLTSANGSTWTPVLGSTQALNLGNNPLAGFGGSQATPRATNSSTWDSVSVAAGSTAPPGVCAPNFSCQDVGNGYAPGNQNFVNGQWQVAAGGSDIWDVFDGFRYVSQSITGDGTLSAEVASVASVTWDDSWEKAGVMMRVSNDPESAYYGVFATPKHGLVVQWRAAHGAATSQINLPGPSPEYPVYLMVGRWTDPHPGGATYYTAYWSTDNKNFNVISGSTVALSMPGTLMAGMAADSYDEKSTLPVTFANFAIFDNTELMPPGACPASVAGCADIGGATPGGNQYTSANGTATDLTINGGGGDIWGASDQFHMVWQDLGGDGSVSGEVTLQQNTDPWAKAGVMIRQTLDPASPYYALLVTPSNGVVLQWRTTAGAQTQQSGMAGALPLYLKVSRYTDGGGNEWFAAYTSTDGATWTFMPGSTQLVGISGPALAGWAVTSHNAATLSTVTFHDITAAAGETVPPGACAAPWTCADLGGATPSGTQDMTSATYSIQGGGGDIWGSSDQFHFVSQSMNADGTLTAQVTSQTATDQWAKAGVMMRASTDPSAPYYAALVTPGYGVVLQWRTTQGGQTGQLVAGGNVPVYLQVVRWTDTSAASPVTYYYAETSMDGTTWAPVTGSAVALTLPRTFLAGLAVTAHNPTLLSTVTFAGASVSGATAQPPGICPGAFTCADLGGATPSGDQNDASGTWTVDAGGGDIWGTSDQFHYIWQTQAGDGSSTAQLTSLGNTNPWSKAGLMDRLSNDPAAPYYAVFVTPGNGLVVQYRTATGVSASEAAAVAGTLPTYLEITRTGTTFTALTSADGTTWTAVPGSTVSIPALTGSIDTGLAVTSHDVGQLVTAVFDTVVLA